MGKEMTKQADRALTDEVVVESLVTRGDISGLSAGEKAAYYIKRCEQLGLDPASKPFAVLRLNGKEVLYAEKGAADQLAAMHRINRKITDGPKVIDLGGKKLLYVQCEASHPNGRVEMDVATVPLAGDLDNLMMKIVTKAKRRATLAILGLGMLDQTEVEGIPDHAKGGTVEIDLPPQHAAVRTERAGLPPPRDHDAANTHMEEPERPEVVEAADVVVATLADFLAGVNVADSVANLADRWRMAREDVKTWREPNAARKAWDAVRARAEALGSSGDKVRALVKRLDKGDEPPPDGDGPRGGRPTSDAPPADAQGEGVDFGEKPLDATKAEALSQWSNHLAAKPWSDAENGAGAVGGSWWKHKARLEREGIGPAARAAVIAELTRRGVKGPATWLEAVKPAAKVVPLTRAPKGTLPVTRETIERIGIERDAKRAAGW